MQNRFLVGKMLIPKPLDINALIHRVPKGKLATVIQIRDKLAKDAHANCCCPLTTGIFLRIVAEVAEEDLRSGKKEVTPYWRVVKADGSLNEKFPGGVQAQAARLERRRAYYRVKNGQKATSSTKLRKILAEAVTISPNLSFSSYWQVNLVAL